MKKNMKRETTLSASQIQATRLNKFEHRRLQHNVNLMNGDLKLYLARLERQAQYIRSHYINVVQFVKPNPAYQLWKQLHGYEIAKDETKNWIEPMKFKQKSTLKSHQQIPSSNEIQFKPVRPLFLLIDDNFEKPVESMIDLNENFLQPTTSPVNKHLHDPHRKSPLLTMSNKQSINSNSPNRFEYGADSFRPTTMPSSSRKLEQSKFITNTNRRRSSHLDALHRIALQNQTAYKPIEQERIEKRKLLDKEFATQHRALKGTVRLTGLVK